MKILTMLAVALTLIACSSDKSTETEERVFTPEMAEAHVSDDQEMERRALEREAQQESDDN
jgi:hypothetical protein